MRFAHIPENANLTILPAVLLAFLLCIFTSQPVAATLYKWIDEDGKVRYSDRLPPDQSKKQHQQLNSQGVVLSTTETKKIKTEEELAEEARLKRELEEQAKIQALKDKQDQVLLLTFSSEKEIEEARDNRIQVIDSVIALIASSITATEEKLVPLQTNANQNYTSQGKDVPGGLAQKIEHFERKIEIRNTQLQAKLEEKEKIRQKYEGDLERFRSLNSASN